MLSVLHNPVYRRTGIACLSFEVEVLYSFVFYEVVYYSLLHFCRIIFEGALAGLEHFRVIENPSSKLFSFLRYSNCCPDIFGHVGNPLDKKPKANLKIYDITVWLTNSCNT